MIKYRKAKMTDIESIHSLISQYAKEGLMLARSRSSLYENLREFTVVEDDGRLVGVGGLHILWSDLAEVRSLAIDPAYAGRGIGRELVAVLEREARELGLPKIFSLTYRTGFFSNCGFGEVSHRDMPQKVWKDCINCPKFPDCDEHAMMKTL